MTRRLVFALAAVALVATGTPAHAQTADLGGIRGSAASSGLHAFYQPKGLLPTGPPLDLGAPDALATIASGPRTFARAGVADPGDLLANPDAVFTQFNASYPSGTVPPWPFRISANSSVGAPAADSNPAPGLSAHVEANSSASHAIAAMPGAAAPAIANAASVTAEAFSRTDGATVITRAVTRTTDFSLLSILHIDSVVTDLTAVTDGVKAKVSGGTKVIGATLAGRKVTIDAKGIHGANKTINSLLARAGITVEVVAPVEALAGSAGQLASSGLRIDFDLSSKTAPAIDGLFDLLPPLENPIPGAPVGVEDIIAAARAHHLVGIQVALGSVSVDARRAGSLAVPDVLGDDDEFFIPSLDLSPTPSLSPLGPAVVAPARSSRSSSSRPAAFPFGEGIAGLVLLALLLQPFLGYRLARAASSIIGGGAVANCTEDQP